MDPITHSLFGAALAASPLGRVLERAPKPSLGVAAAGTHGAESVPAAPAAPVGGGAGTGRWGGAAHASGMATWWLVVAANVPDVDAFLYPISTDLSLLCRRGVTHGILALLLWPLLLAGWWWWRRRREGGTPRFVPAFVVLALAVISHPSLDWLNTYGIRPLMPFSGRWFYGDALFIVDPWVWLGLATGLFLAAPDSRRSMVRWAFFAGLLSWVVFAPPRPLPPWVPTAWVVVMAAAVLVRWLAGRLGWLRPLLSPRRLGALAAAAFLLYAACMALTSRYGRRLVTADLERRGELAGLAPEAVYVGPRLASPRQWDVVVTTPGGYRVGTLDFAAPAGRQLRLEGPILELPDREDPVVRAALAARDLAGLANWLRLPHIEVERSADGWQVWILDLRYTRSRADTFGTVRVDLDADLAVRAVHHGR